MKECNCDLRDGDAKTAVFGSNEMLQPAPVDTIPMEPTTPQIAYQMVKDETFAQTQPRLNLATFVTTYMDDYATKLMNEAIRINYIDETEYPPNRQNGKPEHWLSAPARLVCWEE